MFVVFSKQTSSEEWPFTGLNHIFFGDKIVFSDRLEAAVRSPFDL